MDLLVAPWRYVDPLVGVLLALKLRRFDFLAECLIVEAVARGAAERIGPVDLVVPVPMPWPRRLMRGVDASAELASAASRTLGVPLATPLRRSPLAPRQTGTSRADRLLRAESTLRPRAGAVARLRGRSVLVVDDVVTTGSTLRAMARALRALGATRVIGLAMAATPERPLPAAGASPPSRPSGRPSATGWNLLGTSDAAPSVMPAESAPLVARSTTAWAGAFTSRGAGSTTSASTYSSVNNLQRPERKGTR